MSPGPRLATLVWTGIDYKQPFDFKVQTYKGEPHLTFFLGELLDGLRNVPRVAVRQADR